MASSRSASYQQKERGFPIVLGVRQIGKTLARSCGEDECFEKERLWLVGVRLGAYVFMGIRVWNQMIAYARSGRMP